MRYVDKIKLYIPDEFYGHSWRSTKKVIHWGQHIGDTWYIEYKDTKYPIVVGAKDGYTLMFTSNNKSVCITDASMSMKIRFQKSHGYCNAGKLLYLIDNSVTIGDTGYNAVIHFKHHVGDHILSDSVDYVILDAVIEKDDINCNRRKYLIKCNICGWSGYMYEQSIDSKAQCTCCRNYAVMRGVNDIATTDSWAIPYFKNIEDAYSYHKGSTSKVDMICPICGKEYPDVVISNFFKNTYHLNCPCTGSYRSYGERFVYNLFLQLGIFLTPQYAKNNADWCGNYKYDYYQETKNCIIEVHGLQHYEPVPVVKFRRPVYKEQENDRSKRELALSNGIRHYIELDFRKSTLEYAKNSILSSELPELYSFTESDIDWELCDKDSRSDLEKEVCNTYESDIDCTQTDLALMYGLDIMTIRNYLKHGKKLGICSYDPYSIREKLNQNQIHSVYLAYKDRKLVHIFSSSRNAYETSEQILGVKIPSEHKIVNAEENHFDIFGYVFVMDCSICSYSDYVNLMFDYDKHSLPNNYILNRRDDSGIETYAYYDGVFIGSYASRNEAVRILNELYGVHLPKNIMKYVDTDKVCCGHFTFKTSPDVKDNLVRRGRRLFKNK